jgi:gas vesicle protein
VFTGNGGLAGAPVALLLAPQSGRESREQLREYVQRAEETDHEQADIATQTLAFSIIDLYTPTHPKLSKGGTHVDH